MPVNGKFDDKTKEALIAYQKAHDLKPTGELDAKTFSAMREEKFDRAALVGTVKENDPELAEKLTRADKATHHFAHTHKGMDQDGAGSHSHPPTEKRQVNLTSR